MVVFLILSAFRSRYIDADIILFCPPPLWDSYLLGYSVGRQKKSVNIGRSVVSGGRDMANEQSANNEKIEGAVTEAQFLRAITSFEAIILSQINIKNKLGDRLNWAIQAGIIILGIIAVSIMILLWTLSSQVNRISAVVNDMNEDFTEVSQHMARINTAITSVDQRVGLLEQITGQTASMSREMTRIAVDMESMRDNVDGIKNTIGTVRHSIGNISNSIDIMNIDVQRMGIDMHRMGAPARSINKMFPFMP